MQPHFTALNDLDRRLRRQRRATFLASGIAGCLAVLAIVEALVWGWK
jgi:hypothetical protein